MEKTKLEERGMTDGDYEDDKAAMMQSLVPPNDQRACPRDE